MAPAAALLGYSSTDEIGSIVKAMKTPPRRIDIAKRIRALEG
jgi:hypothetical protein